MAKFDKTPVKQSDEFTPEATELFDEVPEAKELVEDTIAPPEPEVVPPPEVPTQESPKVALDGVLCTLNKDFVKEYYDGKIFPLTSRGVLYVFEPPAYEVRLPEAEAKEYDALGTHPVQIKK